MARQPSLPLTLPIGLPAPEPAHVEPFDFLAHPDPRAVLVPGAVVPEWPEWLRIPFLDD